MILCTNQKRMWHDLDVPQSSLFKGFLQLGRKHLQILIGLIGALGQSRLRERECQKHGGE